MAIPTQQEVNLLHDRMCKAVADPTRIRIMYALSESPCNVTELTEILESPQPTVSRHLALLRQRSIVTSERQGTSVIYRLADDRIISILDTMRDLLRDTIQQHHNTLT